MSITLSNTAGKTVTLWNAQEDKRQAEASVRNDSVYGQDSSEALLTSLESQERFTLTGRATGIRLSTQAEYSSDPLTALAEWMVKLDSFVNGNQGQGYTLTDNERSSTFSGVIESVGFQKEKGAKYELSWDLTFIRGIGASAEVNSPVPSVNPTTTATLNGYDLGELTSYRIDKSQPFEVYPIAYASPGDNEVLAKAGAIRRITIRGRVTGDVNAATDDRNTFDDNIRALMGTDTTYTYASAFPGRSIDVMVDTYESTRKAGITRLGEYNLTLVEGTQG